MLAAPVMPLAGSLLVAKAMLHAAASGPLSAVTRRIGRIKGCAAAGAVSGTAPLARGPASATNSVASMAAGPGGAVASGTRHTATGSSRDAEAFAVGPSETVGLSRSKTSSALQQPPSAPSLRPSMRSMASVRELARPNGSRSSAAAASVVAAALGVAKGGRALTTHSGRAKLGGGTRAYGERVREASDRVSAGTSCTKSSGWRRRLAWRCASFAMAEFIAFVLIATGLPGAGSGGSVW